MDLPSVLPSALLSSLKRASLLAPACDSNDPSAQPSARTSVDLENDRPEASPKPDYRARRKSHPRSKTTYQLALPAPGLSKRFFRPKLLLQLQRVSGTPRPLPTWDVLPGIHGLRRRNRLGITLGLSDIIIVPSDSHDGTVGAMGDDRSACSDDSADYRDARDNNEDLVAAICFRRKAAEIALRDASHWRPEHLPNGSYQFTCSNEHGSQTVRWVLRRKSSARYSGSLAASDNPFDECKRFSFSVIDPHTRRHPIMAWMTRNSIDVLDEYPVLGTTESCRSSSDGEAGPSSEPDMAETDKLIRSLIVVTGIYVAVREGWSRYDSQDESPSMSPVNRSPAREPRDDVKSESPSPDICRSRSGSGLFRRISTRLANDVERGRRSISAAREEWTSGQADSRDRRSLSITRQGSVGSPANTTSRPPAISFSSTSDHPAHTDTNQDSPAVPGPSSPVPVLTVGNSSQQGAPPSASAPAPASDTPKKNQKNPEKRSSRHLRRLSNWLKSAGRS